MNLLSWLKNPSTSAARPHTTTSVLKKLDSNLSDSKRKQFIKDLMSSPHTNQLLDPACRTWLQNLGVEENDVTHTDMKAHQVSRKRYFKTINLINEVQAEIKAEDDRLRIAISEPIFKH